MLWNTRETVPVDQIHVGDLIDPHDDDSQVRVTSVTWTKTNESTQHWIHNIMPCVCFGWTYSTGSYSTWWYESNNTITRWIEPTTTET